MGTFKLKICCGYWTRALCQHCYMLVKCGYKVDGRRRLGAFVMKCYRRFFHVCSTEKNTNNIIKSQINRIKTVTTRITERKITFFVQIFVRWSKIDL